MNLWDLVEVYCSADPSRVALAKSALAAERISCIAHAQRTEEATFPVRFLVPPHLADRARETLARV